MINDFNSAYLDPHLVASDDQRFDARIARPGETRVDVEAIRWALDLRYRGRTFKQDREREFLEEFIAVQRGLQSMERERPSMRPCPSCNGERCLIGAVVSTSGTWTHEGQTARGALEQRCHDITSERPIYPAAKSYDLLVVDEKVIAIRYFAEHAEEDAHWSCVTDDKVAFYAAMMQRPNEPYFSARRHQRHGQLRRQRPRPLPRRERRMRAADLTAGVLYAVIDPGAFTPRPAMAVAFKGAVDPKTADILEKRNRRYNPANLGWGKHHFRGKPIEFFEGGPYVAVARPPRDSVLIALEVGQKHFTLAIPYWQPDVVRPQHIMMPWADWEAKQAVVEAKRTTDRETERLRVKAHEDRATVLHRRSVQALKTEPWPMWHTTGTHIHVPERILEALLALIESKPDTIPASVKSPERRKHER